MVLIVVTVAIIAWQFMDDSHAAEGFDPATDARPQALREPPGEGAATETAETAEGGNESVGADPAADVTANTADVTARAADVAASTAAPAEAGSGSEPDPDAIAAAAAGGAGAPRTTDPSTPQTAARQAGAQPPTTPAADPGVQATPDPMQSAAVEQEPGPPPPAVNSIVAETTGEYEYVDQVHAWIESAFGGQSFDIVDFASSPYGTLQQAARFHVVTTAKLVGTQQLEYFGNTQTQFTVALVSRVIDLSTGTTVIGPETETIRYTSVNMQQNLERGTRQLARRMAQRLRQAIREIP